MSSLPDASWHIPGSVEDTPTVQKIKEYLRSREQEKSYQNGEQR